MRLIPCAAMLLLSTTLMALPAPPGAAQSAADTPEKLRREIEAATAAKDWTKALAAAERLNDSVEADHVEILYQIARIHGLLGRKNEALAWLKRASDAGVVDRFRVRTDEAFTFLKDDERFRALSRAISTKDYVAMLERKGRDEYQMPDRVMQALALKEGERVADVGAGSGYFTVRAARAVGKTGTVWAVDIVPEFLDYIEKRARDEGLSNIKPLKVEKDDPRLPPAGVDTVLMVDTLHYVSERAAYARKLRDGLAPGGRIVIIDFVPKPFSERPWGPPPEQNMSREEVDTAMAAAGLFPVKVHEFLPEQFFVEYSVPQAPRQ
ncbi:MAG: methyltransferase domain-containing protein [Acidobacteria bacterium]|nr:methyltransferase domain-containing protein [Acidobacteriota bacterium]